MDTTQVQEAAAAGMLEDVKSANVTHFKHPMQSVRYLFKNGKPAEFCNHFYSTMDQTEIAELRADAYILGITETEEVIPLEELVNPLVALRAKYFREFKAEQLAARKRAGNINNDAGYSVANPRINASSTMNAIDAGAAANAAMNAATPEGGGMQAFDLNPTIDISGMQTNKEVTMNAERLKALVAGLHKNK